MTEQKTINEEFTLKHSSDNYNKVQQIIDDLQNAKITHTNYQKYRDQMVNANTMIGAQMENLFSSFITMREEFNDLKDQENIRTSYQNGIVPVEFYNLSFNIGKTQNDMLCWKIYQSELAQIFAEKLVPALEEAKSLDIERDVLAGISEMENKRNELQKETVNSMIRSFEENMRMMITQVLFENKQLINEMINLVKDQSKSYAEVIKTLPYQEKTQETPLMPSEKELDRRMALLKKQQDKENIGFDLNKPPKPKAKDKKKKDDPDEPIDEKEMFSEEIAIDVEKEEEGIKGTAGLEGH